jgi:hypothetical protein
MDTESFAAMEDLLQRMVEHQEEKVLSLARRLRPGLTAEDVRNAHDFRELDDSDFHYEDGLLAGLLAAQTALRARFRVPARP